MYSISWGDSCVQVSSNLVPRSSRIKVENRVSGWTGHIRYFYRTYLARPDISGPRLDMSARLFQQQRLMTVWSIIFNRKYDWSHSSSASFVILLESFFCYWKVLSSYSSIVVAWVLILGHTLILVKNFIQIPLTPPPHPLASSVLQLVSKPDRSLVVINRLCDPKAT
jgi:hypothetical protein